MMRNDDQVDPSKDVSDIHPGAGAVDSDGVWKLHLSINPEDMEQAIPIIHEQFCDPNTPKMGLKLASKGLLAGDHQSGKQLAFIFSRDTEISLQGQQKIRWFLVNLANKLENARIRPEATPPLTIETEDEVRRNGSNMDKRNIENKKYDTRIKLRENELLSYFNYRDEMALLFADDLYDEVYRSSPPNERSRMIKNSDFDALQPKFKHNPLKRRDDFLYGLVLEHEPSLVINKASLVFSVNTKPEFLQQLNSALTNPILTRAMILDFFADLKNKNGPYAFIHKQRNPKFDRFRLLFKSRAQVDEVDFWHTATYQQAVKCLKQAYLRLGNTDHSDFERKEEADAFIDYVRGNAPIHFTRTTTRSMVK